MRSNLRPPIYFFVISRLLQWHKNRKLFMFIQTINFEMFIQIMFINNSKDCICYVTKWQKRTGLITSDGFKIGQTAKNRGWYSWLVIIRDPRTKNGWSRAEWFGPGSRTGPDQNRQNLRNLGPAPTRTGGPWISGHNNVRYIVQNGFNDGQKKQRIRIVFDTVLFLGHATYFDSMHPLHQSGSMTSLS